MKKLIWMAAGALPLMFVACTNELENVAVEETQQAPQEIVGANLVSQGMTISVNRGNGVESRINNAGDFVDGDKVGLAWYKANGVGTIYDEQLNPLTHNWNTYMATAPSDNKIFGNHKFTKNGGDFSTDANVYEGFHFAYYPYAYEKKVDKKIVTPNANPQKGTSADELYNEAFYISAQDSLLATSANEDGTISKTFNLAKVVWGLHFDLTPGKDILAMEYLKDFQIRNVQIQTGGDAWGAKFFNPTAQIIPGNLPYALYDAETGEYKAEETEAQLYKMNLYGEYSAENDNNLAFAFTENAGMMTTVVENPAMQLNAYNEVRMFLFPTDNYASLIPAEELAVEVHVDCGKFRFYCEDAESNNGKQLLKLREFLSVGINEGTGPKASVLENANIGFDFDLTGADFIPDFTSITNITEWENAVKLVKDLKLENPEFTVDGNVEFTESITMPEDGVVVTTIGEGQLNVIGNVILPEDLKMDSADKFVVSAGATLTVADDVELTAAVINKGTIKAGKKSLISQVDNTLGRIEVVYGSYVETETGKDGVVAYEVLKSSETPSRINTLINGGNNGMYARVNTLVINKGVTFDLMMKTVASSEEDPYYTGVTTTNVVTDLKDIAIEMNGGTIKGEKEVTKNVKSVEVISGTNTIKDINILTNLEVAEGAKVTIDATEHYHGTFAYKHEVKVGGDMINKGQVTATANVRVTNIDNEEGKTVVNSGYTMWYKNVYIQGGIAQGKILKAALSTVWDGYTVKEPALIDGVYQVSEAAELAWFAGKKYGGVGAAKYSLKIKLNADLNMDGFDFNGISIEQDDYSGTSTVEFDGNNKTIKGLNLISPSAKNVGLFTTVEAQLNIKNLTIAKSEANADSYCGMLIGYNYGTTIVIDNVAVEDCTLNAKKTVGAFIGNNTESGTVTIKNSSVEGCKIAASEKRGGIFIGCYTNAVTLSTSGNTAINNTLTVNNVPSSSLYTKYE